MLDKYGNKINSYKSVHKELSKASLQFLKIAWSLFESKIGRGIIFFTFAGIINMSRQFPLVIGIAVSILIVLFAGLRFFAKHPFKRFKEDLIQAIFLDHSIRITHHGNKSYSKENFNQTNFHDKAYFLNSEDYIEGTTSDFHFKFCELNAKGNISWIGLENVFQGLYFQGTWNEFPIISNFKLKRISLLDGVRLSNEESVTSNKFSRYFAFYDLENNPIDLEKSKFLLPLNIQNKLINLARKYDEDFQIIFQDQKLFVFIKGTRDYFPIHFWQKVEGKEVYEKLVLDSLFFIDLIRCFTQD